MSPKTETLAVHSVEKKAIQGGMCENDWFLVVSGSLIIMFFYEIDHVL